MKIPSLGIIGYSADNGAPYLWPAIFNGFDADLMADCPFPGVAETLARRAWPDDFLSTVAKVEHIWTQKRGISDHIAQATNIPYIAEDYVDLIGRVDAILLARDDSENHLRYARPFIEAGIPIYIGAPLAASREGARQLLGLEQFEGQIFTCSPLRYAQEFKLTPDQLNALGELRVVEASTPGTWEQNAIDIIEPVVELFGHQAFNVLAHHRIKTGQVNKLQLHLRNGLAVSFTTTGDGKYPLLIRLTIGSERSLELHYQDSFIANRETLKDFIYSNRLGAAIIPRESTAKVIDLIELGC